MEEIEVVHYEHTIKPEVEERICREMEEKYTFADRKAPEDVPAD